MCVSKRRASLSLTYIRTIRNKNRKIFVILKRRRIAHSILIFSCKNRRVKTRRFQYQKLSFFQITFFHTEKMPSIKHIGNFIDAFPLLNTTVQDLNDLFGLLLAAFCVAVKEQPQHADHFSRLIISHHLNVITSRCNSHNN